MLHPQVIARKIQAIEQAKGIKLVEFSVEQSIRMYDHFRSLEQEDGNKISYARDGELPENFKYTDEERRWIQNEMYMCACSFRYWFFRYFFIKTLEGHIQRPDVLVAQLIYLDILSELDLAGLPILLLVLKARQLGLSTITEAIILWISIFIGGSKCVIASAEEEKSEAMSNMVWLGLEKLPMWMQPVLTRDDRKLGPEFGLIHSEILLQHGSMSKGIARGDTPIAAHLSEVAWYPDPINTIESSLIRAMHENPRTFLVLESTAKRKDDWLHRTWLKNRKGEDTGYNRFICLFLPWYVGHDKYPTKDWLHNHPIPPNWRPMKETLKQAADAKLYVATTPLLKKHMAPDWQMPIEQMWYWEFSYVEAKEGGDETYKSFLAELAADERSCFQSKKFSVFDQTTLDALEENKQAKYTDYAIVGSGIDEKYWLKDYWSYSRQRIEVNYVTIKEEYLKWQLIPLKETPKDDKQKFYLRVFQLPQAGYLYNVGIDTSSGQGQNNTVYLVNRYKLESDETDYEAAILCSPWIPSPDSPGFALVLGAFYGQYMSPVREAMIAPEVQISVGDFISYQLAKEGYSNFYYMKRFDLRQAPGHKPNRRGWASVSWSKQMMQEAFEHAIKSGWFQVNSDDLLEELSWLESDETESGKVVYDHANDKTNDCYIAGGIAYFTAHGEETIMARIKANLKPKKKTKVEEEPAKLKGLDLLRKMLEREDESFRDARKDGKNNVF
jgi:hypothetical protein